MQYDLTEFRVKMAAIKDNTIAGRSAQFILLRDELAKMDKEYEAVRKPLLDIKALLEGYFEKFLTSTGQQSAVTPHGTVHWNTRTTAALQDPEAFMDFVKANERWDLLDRRANAPAVREYAEKEGNLPPGVGLNTMRSIGVNKPGAKAKGAQ